MARRRIACCCKPGPPSSCDRNCLGPDEYSCCGFIWRTDSFDPSTGSFVQDAPYNVVNVSITRTAFPNGAFVIDSMFGTETGDYVVVCDALPTSVSGLCLLGTQTSPGPIYGNPCGSSYSNVMGDQAIARSEVCGFDPIQVLLPGTFGGGGLTVWKRGLDQCCGGVPCPVNVFLCADQECQCDGSDIDVECDPGCIYGKHVTWYPVTGSLPFTGARLNFGGGGYEGGTDCGAAINATVNANYTIGLEPGEPALEVAVSVQMSATGKFCVQFGEDCDTFPGCADNCFETMFWYGSNIDTYLNSRIWDPACCNSNCQDSQSETNEDGYCSGITTCYCTKGWGQGCPGLGTSACGDDTGCPEVRVSSCDDPCSILNCTACQAIGGGAYTGTVGS